MVLRKICLKNFRQFEQKEVEFSSQTTLIVGRNSAGKTNLLESIYLLATGHSFRGGKDEDLIAYGCEMASLRGQTTMSASGPGRPTEEIMEIMLTKGEVVQAKAPLKRCLINSVPKRMMDFVGNLRVVLFRPEDLEIIIDSPSIRRNYLDSVLEPVDREYRRASLSYKKGIRQRNKLLEQIKDGRTTRTALYFWDKLLVENGSVITSKREEFIQFINNQPDYFEDLEIEYDKSLISPERLEKYQQEEVAAGMTLVGPHRDDFRLSSISKTPNAKRDLSVYGSRGEQRLAIFSLKLAELEFVTQKTNQRPILLLDDIFSELDESNRERLLEVIPKQQTLITATELDVIDKDFRQNLAVIEL